MEITDGAVIKCNYKLCAKVVNKFNIKLKTPSIVIPSRDNINIFYESRSYHIVT
jgi:hypothetical protein